MQTLPARPSPPDALALPHAPSPAPLADRYRRVRAHSLARIAGLSAEDCQLQSMAEASPMKWHLGHTSWFFETLVLQAHEPGFAPVDPAYRMLFNSYYVGLGERLERSRRGMLSRPSLDEVLVYRREVDARMLRLIDGARAPAQLALVELGLQHEEQHQELMLTDQLHHFACNPLRPGWQPPVELPRPLRHPSAAVFAEHPGGLVEIGASAAGFSFDHERPRHAVWLEPFRIADEPVGEGAFLAFVADGGYERPALWMSDGWDWLQAQRARHPLHWLPGDDASDAAGWRVHTPWGVRPLDPSLPAMNLSWYEADAYARWRGAQLPTEAQWEAAAAAGLLDAIGQAWEWTDSAFRPYPGFAPDPGAVGEYNGKFMINQMVLRGGSIATPAGHARPEYRNFFPPSARWQFSGLRLALPA